MTNQSYYSIVIPIYKTELTPFEKISFEQCIKIFNNIDIIIIKPESLILPEYLRCKTISITFDDEFFTSIQGYNKLMLSDKFYFKFLKYNYILLYQLDAFVFSNNIDYWCRQDYDYIGAPWLRERQFKSKYKLLKENIKSYFHRRYNIIEKTGMPALDKQLANQVGNGGFSLRKTKIFYEVCVKSKEKIKKYLDGKNAYFNEDIFFSIEINRKKNIIKIPKYRVAIKFAFETFPERALKLNGNKLPFGCHAWEKHLDFWRPYFKDLDYKI
jgi:hypothetical protein